MVTAHFNISTNIYEFAEASRMDLVFESSNGLSFHQPVLEICHTDLWRFCNYFGQVRHRRLEGGDHGYSIYNVNSKAVSAWWSSCNGRSTCSIEFRLHSFEQNATSSRRIGDTLLVVYQNLYVDLRATRRALRALTHGSWNSDRESSEERQRREIVSTDQNTYCSLHSWNVNFSDLGWSWIVAPRYFVAGLCIGMCPSGHNDLERANLTNHAFLRMVHRALLHNGVDKEVPAPSCVPVRYSTLSILYRTDSDTYELRNVNEMVALSCGCL